MGEGQIIALGELGFLVGAAMLISGGCRAALKAKKAQKSVWKHALPWFACSFLLVFARHWAMDQEVFRAPAQSMGQHVGDKVAKAPELVKTLQEFNDGFFHYVILLGIPAAFLLGYLFHMMTGLAGRWLFRLPVFLIGCLLLFVLHQIVTKRADGVGEALHHLWTALSGNRSG